jgi:hypothetical protein
VQRRGPRRGAHHRTRVSHLALPRRYETPRGESR